MNQDNVIVESFELTKMNIPRLSPNKTRNEMITSFTNAGWSNYKISKILDSLNSRKLRYSYKFSYKDNEYLLYELYDKSIKEYHFFNLDRPDESAETINSLNNSIQVFSMIFNIIYKDILEGNFKNGVKIISNEKRNKLYRKIFDKVNKKYDLKLVLKDVKKDSFVIDIPRPKSFKESVRLS